MSEDIEDHMEGNDYIKPDAIAVFKHMLWLWSSCVESIIKAVRNSQRSRVHELLRVW